MISHSPPSAPVLPSNRIHTPEKSSPMAATWPTRAATVLAQRRSSPANHSSPRSTRPPSSGYAGTRLKMPSGIFIVASHMPSAATGGATSHSIQLTMAASSPMATLVTGPITAISSSARGDGDSRVMCAMPPSRNRLIVRTGMPNLRAARAWPSSWAYRLTTDSSAATMASDHSSTWLKPRRRPRKVE